MTPIYLFDASRRLRKAIRRKLQACQQLILFMDFDGTLASIEKTPAAVSMPARTRNLVRLLALHPNVLSGIVTGRSLRDIRQRVGGDDQLLVANHGFEIFHAGMRWVHPRVEENRPMLNRLARKIGRRLNMIPGVYIENKQYTISVHYRMVERRSIRRVRTEVFDLFTPFKGIFKITEGKKVIELRPHVPWNKGVAVQRVLRLLKSERLALVIYVGDDTSDEDAFKALRRVGTTIVVGKKRKTSASYWVRNPAGVQRFLKILGTAMEEKITRPHLKKLRLLRR